MTPEEIRNLNLEQVEARMAEIRGLLNDPSADLDALSTEIDNLEARRSDLRSAAEQRAALMQRVASGQAGVTLRSLQGLEGAAPAQRSYDASSPEYRSAWLRVMAGAEMEELSAEERAAFVHTTANTTAPLPTTMLDQIWDLVSGQHAIMDDVTIYRTGTTLEVIKHTAIAQGSAATVSEDAANSDEQNTFVKVTLSGKDFSKHVDISYAMQRMSIDSLEAYLVAEISRELGRAIAEDVVTQIGTDMDNGNKVTTAAVGTVTFKEIAAAFGLLERADNVVVYARRSTIYNHLVGMVDDNKRPIFQLNAQAGAAGSLIGAVVKVEDAVADGVLLIGDAGKVTYNMVQDIMIESDKDIKKHVTTYSGYARGSGALIAPKAFAELTVKTSA